MLLDGSWIDPTGIAVFGLTFSESVEKLGVCVRLSMLGRRNRRVGTVPALGGDVSIVWPEMDPLPNAESEPKSRDEEEDDDVGDAASLNASDVEAKRTGEVGMRENAGMAVLDRDVSEVDVL